MITFLLILSLYSAILSTILFVRWMRILIARRNVKEHIKEENLSPEKVEFLTAYPPLPLTPFGQAIKDITEEMDGEVIRGFETDLNREESEEFEETVEEREWREEEKIKHQRQARR